MVAIAAMGWKLEENQNKWNAKNEREQREALYRPPDSTMESEGP